MVAARAHPGGLDAAATATARLVTTPVTGQGLLRGVDRLLLSFRTSRHLTRIVAITWNATLRGFVKRIWRARTATRALNDL